MIRLDGLIKGSALFLLCQFMDLQCVFYLAPTQGRHFLDDFCFSNAEMLKEIFAVVMFDSQPSSSFFPSTPLLVWGVWVRIIKF